MSVTRREFGKLALATVPAALSTERSLAGSLFAQARPNSLINGVQIGAITYSYRSMPDQSAEATLRYIVESGISAVELMGGPTEAYAGAPVMPRPPAGAWSCDSRPHASQENNLSGSRNRFSEQPFIGALVIIGFASHPSRP